MLRSFFVLGCAFIVFLNTIEAQITGISATKLSAINAFPVPQRVAEFEPTFGLCRTSGGWGERGFRGSDTISVSGNINWRLSYGLLDNFEIGFNVLSDASFGNFTMKSKVLERGDFALGIMGGLGMPLGERTYAHSDPSIDDVSNYGIGLAMSYEMDSLASVDFSVQYQDYFRDVFQTTIIDPIPGPFPMPVQTRTDRLTGSTFFLNADMGSYVIADGLLTVLGVGYQSSVIDDLWSANLFFEAGVSLEFISSYAVVLAMTHSVWGRNSEKTTMVGLSFTTVWE